MKTRNSGDFRKELIKIMPGYKWTIHRHMPWAKHLSATGIQSSGLNRLSTLHVIRREKDDVSTEYEVESAGYGRRARWLSVYTDSTLASALRGLQNYYEGQARLYSNHAGALQGGRKRSKEDHL